MATDHDAKMLAQQWLLAQPHVPQPGQLWRHWKGGLYRIVALSLHEDTLEPLVTYRSEKYGTHWTRTLDNFLSTVKDENGLRARFTIVRPGGLVSDQPKE